LDADSEMWTTTRELDKLLRIVKAFIRVGLINVFWLKIHLRLEQYFMLAHTITIRRPIAFRSTRLMLVAYYCQY